MPTILEAGNAVVAAGIVGAALGVGRIFCTSGFTQIAKPVVITYSVNVIDIVLGPCAVYDQPSNPVCEIILPINTELNMAGAGLVIGHLPGKPRIPHFVYAVILFAALPSERASLGVVGKPRPHILGSKC